MLSVSQRACAGAVIAAVSLHQIGHVPFSAVGGTCPAQAYDGLAFQWQTRERPTAPRRGDPRRIDARA